MLNTETKTTEQQEEVSTFDFILCSILSLLIVGLVLFAGYMFVTDTPTPEQETTQSEVRTPQEQLNITVELYTKIQMQGIARPVWSTTDLPTRQEAFDARIAKSNSVDHLATTREVLTEDLAFQLTAPEYAGTLDDFTVEMTGYAPSGSDTEDFTYVLHVVDGKSIHQAGDALE